jgi:hypothetical protein
MLGTPLALAASTGTVPQMAPKPAKVTVGTSRSSGRCAALNAQFGKADTMHKADKTRTLMRYSSKARPCARPASRLPASGISNPHSRSSIAQSTLSS